MRRIAVILFLVLGIVTTNSCKKLDEFTQFNLEYTTEVTVPATAVIDLPIDILTPDMETNYEDQLSNNDTRTDLVQEITLSAMSFTAKSPQGSNLDFLKSVQVFISAEGLSEIAIASKNDIPDGLTKLDLEVSSVNLKDYIKKETIKFRVKTVTDKSISEERDLEIFNRFRVNAEILGV